MTNNKVLTFDVSKFTAYCAEDVILTIGSGKSYIRVLDGLWKIQDTFNEDMKNFKSCLTGLSPKGKVIEDDKSFMKLLYNWSDEYIDKLYKRYMDELKSNRKIYDYSKEDKRKWRNQ